jgi:hypothetical protein
LRKDKVCCLALLIAVTLFLAVATPIPRVFAQSDQPVQIHLTWDQNDTAHTIVVTWQTKTAGAGDVVLYDTKSGSGEPSNYASSQTGTSHTYSDADGYIHDVELTGLSSDTIYYFICGGDNGGWSGERSFRTAPDNSISFRFVAGGDSRSGSGDWPAGRDSVSREMAKFNPSFVLYVGDFVYQGDYQSEWDNWFAAEQMYWVDNDSLTIPIIPCLGNHDVSRDGGTAYFGQFSLPTFPADEKWYSLDWGPNLHITVLDTETGVGGDQTTWLQQDLAEHENYMWKVVLFHRPPFSGGPDGIDTDVRRYWVPLFDEYHVDLVISGHNHLYERTYPINYTISESTPASSPENGTVYIVSGGWGAPIYSGTDSWAAVGPISKYSFTVVDILDNGMLHLTALDANGNILDDYSILKAVPESAKPTSTLPFVIAGVILILAFAVIAVYILKVSRKS